MRIVWHTIVPKPSICAPSWILIASPFFSAVSASLGSDASGVYGVMKELGEIVVGWEIPETCLSGSWTQNLSLQTFEDFLALVYLPYLFFQ